MPDETLTLDQLKKLGAHGCHYPWRVRDMLRLIEEIGRTPRAGKDGVATMNRPTWDEYFMEFAKTAAARSTCLRVPDGVGAVLVRDKQVLATGYAGSIRGAKHCADVGCLIDQKTGGCVRTVHAETNAIVQAAQHGVSIDGATMYTTMSPCWECYKILANAGVQRIVYLVEYRDVVRQAEHAGLFGIRFEHVSDKVYVPGVPRREL